MKKIAKILLVRELWMLFVGESLINCGAFEADKLLMKPNCTKNQSELRHSGLTMDALDTKGGNCHWYYGIV